MIVVTVLLLAAAVALAIAQAARLPDIPLFVLAGIAVALTGQVEAELLDQVLLLGLTVLVFMAGTELNPRGVGRYNTFALAIGLIQFGVLGLTGFGLASALGYGVVASLHLALALAASSTLVVVGIIRKREQFYEPYARLVIGVLLVQDVLVVVLLSFLQHVEPVDVGALGVTAASLALFGLLTVAMVKWITPYLLITLELDDETHLLGAMAILFSFAGIAHFIGLPPIVGAFFAGVSLSGFPVSGLLRGQLSSLSDYFFALFFVTLGATLTVPSLDEVLLVGAMAVFVLTITPALVALVARLGGLSFRGGIESGLLLAQCSEFSLVVAILGSQSGAFSDELLSVVSLITVVTMILTPFIATHSNATWLMHRFSRHHVSPDESVEDHVVILGGGTSGQALARALHDRGVEVVVIDDDPVRIEEFEEHNFRAVLGSGVDRRVLEDARIQDACAVVSTMPRLQDNETLLDLDYDTPMWIRVFEGEDAAIIEDRGADAIVYCSVAIDDFLAWFDQNFTSGRSDEEE